MTGCFCNSADEALCRSWAAIYASSCFPEAGLYTFTASVTDELGRVTTATASIQIYPAGVSGFYLPKMFHTDSVVTLVTGFAELGENPLRWSLTRNGENADSVIAEMEGRRNE